MADSMRESYTVLFPLSQMLDHAEELLRKHYGNIELIDHDPYDPDGDHELLTGMEAVKSDSRWHHALKLFSYFSGSWTYNSNAALATAVPEMLRLWMESKDARYCGSSSEYKKGLANDIVGVLVQSNLFSVDVPYVGEQISRAIVRCLAHVCCRQWTAIICESHSADRLSRLVKEMHSDLAAFACICPSIGEYWHELWTMSSLEHVLHSFVFVVCLAANGVFDHNGIRPPVLKVLGRNLDLRGLGPSTLSAANWEGAIKTNSQTAFHHHNVQFLSSVRAADLICNLQVRCHAFDISVLDGASEWLQIVEKESEMIERRMKTYVYLWSGGRFGWRTWEEADCQARVS